MTCSVRASPEKIVTASPFGVCAAQRYVSAVQVWWSEDRVWRLECSDDRSLPYRLEWRGGWVASGRSMREIVDWIAAWVVERGEPIPLFREV